jgi:hypothetical protein
VPAPPVQGLKRHTSRNAADTHDLGSERICGPKEPDSSHIISHGVKLIGIQIKLFNLRST